MDNCVILHIYSVVEHLLPYHVPVLGGVGAHDVQQLLDVDGLQLVIVASHVPLPHEGCDVRIALPSRKVC